MDQPHEIYVAIFDYLCVIFHNLCTFVSFVYLVIYVWNVSYVSYMLCHMSNCLNHMKSMLDVEIVYILPRYLHFASSCAHFCDTRCPILASGNRHLSWNLCSNYCTLLWHKLCLMSYVICVIYVVFQVRCYISCSWSNVRINISMSIHEI